MTSHQFFHCTSTTLLSFSLFIQDMIILQLALCIVFFLATRTFGFTVEVRFDGTSKRFEVGSGESILEAMERNQIDKKFGISLSQDCRRGSCLSCSAILNNECNLSSLTSDDSLNEVASREMRKNGLVLLSWICWKT